MIKHLNNPSKNIFYKNAHSQKSYLKIQKRRIKNTLGKLCSYLYFRRENSYNPIVKTLHLFDEKLRATVKQIIKSFEDNENFNVIIHDTVLSGINLTRE